MIDRKEVELLIRAQLKGGRDLDSITASIGKLEKAIDEQAAAAKRGESSYDGMKAAAEGLKGVQDQLAGRSKTIQDFEKLTKEIDKQSNAVDAAKKKLADYERELGQDRTAKQQQQLQKLTKSLQGYEEKLERAKMTQAVFGEELRKAGADTSNLGAEQLAVAAQQTKAVEAQARLNKELVDYVENVNKAKKAASELAAKQGALLSKLQTGNATDTALADKQIARAKQLEQIESDRLATLLKFGQAQQQARGKAAADSELAAIADSAKFVSDLGAKTSRDTGLKKLADDAQQATQQVSTLARASTDLRPRITSLRDAVDEIINPAAAARKTLNGIETEIKELANTISGSKGPVKDYASQFKSLAEAQKVIQGQAGLIDSFKNQTAAVRDARAEFVAARTAVNQYADAVRAGGDSGASFVRPLAEAQAKLRQTATALRDQVTAAREARDALRQAGISTGALADAERRLVEATKTATAAMRELDAAAEKNGKAVRDSGKSFSLFNDEGRTTLSLAQRIRGEILALAAAYIGVQGAIGLAAGALKAFTQAQGLSSTLSFALGGDPGQTAKEIVYIKEQVDRLGVAFEQASKGYARFAAAAIKSGASVQETRFIFESFAEVARVINLTPDELNGLFNAIGQSFSKGKIQAEELRQQIGERLPGAFAFAQKALAKVFPNLNKALEEGKVGAENFVLIAESIRKAAEGQLPKAIQSLDAEQQRFNNSVLFFKQQIAESGFADAYVAMLKQLTEIMKGDDGTKFAQSLSDIASAIVNSISFVADYRKEFTLLAQVLGALFAGKIISSIGGSLVSMGNALNVAAVAATAATPALAALAVAFRVLTVAAGALFAGFAFGTYLREQSVEVRVFGTYIVQFFISMFKIIGVASANFADGFKSFFENAFKNVLNAQSLFARKFLGFYATFFRAIGQTETADMFQGVAEALEFKPAEEGKKRVGALMKELEDLAKVFDQMRKDERNPPVPATVVPKTEPGTTEMPPVRKSTLVDDAGAKKRQNEIESIQKALETMQAKTLRKQEDTLGSLLQAVDTEYAELGRRIAALGGAKGKEFAESFRKGVAALKGEITQDFNEKLLKEQEALNAKLDALDAQAGRKNKEELQGRLDAIRLSAEGTFKAIEDLQKRSLQASGPGSIDRQTAQADQARARAEAAVTELQNLEKRKFLTEQLAKNEERINDLLKSRDIALKQVAEKRATGELTPGRADAASQAVIAEFQPKINETTEAFRAMAEANAAAFDPMKLQEFLLKLEQAKNSAIGMNAEFDKTKQIIDTGIGRGIDNTFNALYESIGKVTQGTADWGDVFEAAGRSILQSLADILKEIALTILKEQILIQIQLIRIALGGASGGGSAGTASIPANVAHSGGIIGSTVNRTRSVPAAWFAGAPRYHSGGMVGMSPNEVPAILQKNEEVLSTSDPRNTLNGGGKQNTTGEPKSQRFVLVDDRSRVAEAMNSPDGEAVTMVHLRRNIPTLRQLLKG